MAKRNKRTPGMYFDTGGYEEPSSVKPPVVKPPNRQEQKQEKEEETYQWQPERSAPAPTYSYEEVEAQEPSAPTPPPPVRVTETPSPVATPPAPATTKPTYSPTAQQLTAHWTGAGQNQPATDREGIGGTRVPQGTMITSTPQAPVTTEQRRDEAASFTYDGKNAPATPAAERTPAPPPPTSRDYTYQPAETPPAPVRVTEPAGKKTGVEAAFERQAMEAERRGGFLNNADIMSAFENALTLGSRTSGQTEPTTSTGRPLHPIDPRASGGQISDPHGRPMRFPDGWRAPAGETSATQTQGNTPELLADKYGIKNAYPTDPDRGKIPAPAGETSATQTEQWSGKESDLPEGTVTFKPGYGQDRDGEAMTVGVKLPWREEGYSEEELRHYKQIPARYDANRRDPNIFFGKYNWFEGYYRAPNGRYYPIGSGGQGKVSGPFRQTYSGGPSGSANGGGSGNAGGGQPSQTVRELDRYYNINKNWSF